MKTTQGMRPQDVVVLLRILTIKDPAWRQKDVADALQLSQTEIATSLERSMRAGLLDDTKRKVFKAALLEFLQHGLRYVFPAQPGALTRGLPTAHSHTPLANTIVASADDVYVWPTGDGEVRGQSVTPLYPALPEAARRDPEFHELLALVDALRVGRTRERALAMAALEQRVRGHGARQS